MNFELFLSRRLTESKLNKSSYAGPIIKICSLAICISIIVIIITLSTGHGLQTTITQNLINTESHLSISSINLENTKQPISINNMVEQKILSIKEVKNVYPIIIKSGIIKYNQKIEGVLLKGVDINYKNQLINNHIIDGKYFTEKNENEILISLDDAKKIKLKTGDSCIVYFLSKSNNIQKRRFSIIGIFDMQNEKFNENYSFVKKETLQKINKWNQNDVTNYEIMLNTFEDTESILKKINKIIDFNLIAKSIKERFSGIFMWIQLFDKNILLICVIMCFICIINMTNTILILIIERLKMIGVLKSFGCSNNSILKIFLYNSFIIAVKSLFIGNIIGISLCLIQDRTQMIKLNPESYFVNYLPIEINYEWILIINILMVIMIQISLIIPFFVIKKLPASNILKIE